MGSLWRDSVHGAAYAGTGKEGSGPERATALLIGIDPVRASALVRTMSPLARARLASDLMQALDMARELQPDVIMLGGDIGAHDVGEALAALSADPALEDIPAIVLASHDDDGTRSYALRGGALAWLPPTVDAEAVLARVRLAVRMRRNAQARGAGGVAAARR